MSGISEIPEVAMAADAMAAWANGLRADAGIKRIGLTSVGGGTADAPVAALALARSLTMTGQRVVLLDIARMGAFLGGLCGVPQGPGLSDLIMGNTPFTKVIARDTRSTAHVLRFGLDHSEQAAQMIHDRLPAVLDALAQSYDFCIVNLGEAIEETPVYLHKCEAALIMAPAARLTEAEQAVETLLATGLTAAHHVLIGQAIRSADAPGNVQPMAVAG
jgi:Mrp family chromosome partitioning ATPase